MTPVNPTVKSHLSIDTSVPKVDPDCSFAAYEHVGTLDKWQNDYYSSNASRYYDEAVAKAFRQMQVTHGANILDAGCGTGVHAIRLCQLGAKVIAVDISNTMLDHARANAAKAGLAGHIEFTQIDIAASGLQPARFDHVFSWGVLIHIPDFDAALDNLMKALKPGGTMALYLTNEGALDLKLERLARKLTRKPPKAYIKNRWGRGFWHDMPGGKMWTNHLRATALISYMHSNQFKVIHHSAGELTELQKYARGRLKRFTQSMNYWLFRFQYPVSWGATQLLVFKKAGGDNGDTQGPDTL